MPRATVRGFFNYKDLMTERNTVGQTSSIGAVWPPEPSSHQRLRGFYTEGVVRTEVDAALFAAQFADQHKVAQKTEGISRLSIRVVAHAGSLATLERMGVGIEAALPLAGTEPGLVVAYTAANEPDRSMDEGHVAAHQELLGRALARPQRPAHTAAQLASRGLTPHTVGRADASALTPRFAPLYAPFNYDETDVAELLANPNNTIAYIADGDRIVSTAMAEHAAVTVRDLGTISLVEITEASTDPEYRGYGLYKAVSGHLTHQLQASGQPMHALYGESNLAQPGVVYAAHENGRRFAHFDAAEYGLDGRADFGMLAQNFRVADGAETRTFNDFALSYVPLG
jgi:hypothetical protein